MRNVIAALSLGLLLTGCGPSEPVPTNTEPAQPTVEASPQWMPDPNGGVAAEKLCAVFTPEEVREVVGEVTSSGANAPEECRFVSAQYTLDITVVGGDLDDFPVNLKKRFDDKTDACPDDATRTGGKANEAGFNTGTWCKVDDLNYIVEVFALDDAGNSTPITKAQATDPLMVKLLERT